jgi:hypothetical protein
MPRQVRRRSLASTLVPSIATPPTPLPVNPPSLVSFIVILASVVPQPASNSAATNIACFNRHLVFSTLPNAASVPQRCCAIWKQSLTSSCLMLRIHARCFMRTTLRIDDQLARELKEIALRSGRRFNDVVNEALLAGLQTMSTPPRERVK